MDVESVIEQLEHTLDLILQNDKDWWDERDIPVLEKAIEVCKKEVPKKPIHQEPLREFYRCPACEHLIPTYILRCMTCGQAIEWGEEGER